MEAREPKRLIPWGAAAWTRARAEGEPELAPVTILQARECAFKKRPENKRGCATCGQPKSWHGHYGAPPSLNVGGSGGNHFTYQNTKRLWQEILTGLLEESGLPKGLGRITVEGTMCFPTRARRDQGNFRFMVEKALGDALRDGGWIEDDDWTRYEFGSLRMAYGRGESWTELVLTPAWETSQIAEGFDLLLSAA